MNRQLKPSLSEEGLGVGGLFRDESDDPFSKSLSSCGDMSRQGRARRSRRLPRILLHRKQCYRRSFWPTYRGAVEWLRQREEDVNTALGLLELYPNLIQEAPFDGLWAFLSPLISALPATVTQVKGTTRTRDTKTGAGVPAISVTSPVEEAAKTATSDTPPLVYVFLKFQERDSEMLSSKVSFAILGEIGRHCFTKVCSGGSFSDSSVSRVAHDVRKCSAVIFLLSQEALEDRLSGVVLAVTRQNDVPVIFVRDSSFWLPNPLPAFLFEADSGPTQSFRWAGRPGSRTRSDTPAVNVNKEVSRINGRHQALSVPIPPKSPRLQSGKRSRKPSAEKRTNSAEQVMEGFRNSLVYSGDNLPLFMGELLDNLSKVLHIEAGMSRRFEQAVSLLDPPDDTSVDEDTHLRVPHSVGSVSGDEDSVLGPSEYGSYDGGLDRVFDDDLDDVGDFPGDEVGLDSGVSSPMEKETTYVIYPPLESTSPADGPRVVRWPPKGSDSPPGSRESDGFNPFFDSPRGFEDINLAAVLDSD